MIRENFGYKVFALLAAIALWAYVNSERSPTTTVRIGVPVEARNLGRQLTASGLPERLDVVVTGPKGYVEGLAPGDISAYVNARGLSPGARVKLPVRLSLSQKVRDRVTAKPTMSEVTVTIREIAPR